MDNQPHSKSLGDEILEHLERNAAMYIQTQDQNTIDLQQILQFIHYHKYLTKKSYKQTPQLMIPIITISPQIPSLKEIKLVNSLLVTGDGQHNSVKLICQNCKKQIQTKLTRRVGKGALIVSCILLLCSFGILCLTCLPCYIDDCKDIVHLCPDCQFHNGSTPYQVF